VKKNTYKIINVILGIAIFTCIAVFAKGNFFTQNAAIALATMTLMIYWWITKPVHLAVTALLPVIVTALFNIVPIATILDDYSSPIVVLLIGANILTLTWSIWGLDRRIALRMLILIGSSFRQQLIIWFLISVILSAFLPNAVVAAALCPIALAMMNHCASMDESLKNTNIKYWILLVIVWGAGLGGFGTPMGGAMNLVAIGHIESLLNTEYMYITWTLKMLPYLIGLTLSIVVLLLLVKLDVSKLSGSRTYFKESYKSLGKMSRSEKIAIVLFLCTILLAFTRPLYEKILPQFAPPYAFLAAGVLAFFIQGEGGKPLISWEYAVKNINWSLAILFAGGMAAGSLLVSTGAAEAIANIVAGSSISGALSLVMIFVLIGIFLANTSSNTAASAALIPVVIGVVSALPYNTLAFVYVTAAACNSAFLLPTSIRAIPLAYDMDTNFMLKKGIPAVIITYISLVAIGYFAVTMGGAA